MATLSGNKIKDTYQSLIKLTDNGNLTTGAKQLTDGFGNNSPLYISTTQIGIGVTPEATYDLHVYSNAKVGGNLTVTGDLTVEGTTTTIDTQTLTVEDPLIEVASNNTSTDAVDIGWYGKYAPSGTVLYAGLFRDTGDSKFKLFRNLEEEPTTTVNTSGTGYTVATLVADVEGTLTGTIASSTVATTQSANDNSTKVATTAYVDTSAGNYLPLAGGTMSGNIAMGGNNISGGGTFTATTFNGELSGTISSTTTATTQTQGDNSTKLATTAYVDSAIGGQDTLAEILANGNTTGGTDIAVSSGDDITFADSSKSIYGAGNDLEIYHDGTNASFISNTNTSLPLQIFSDDLDIKSYSLQNNMIVANSGGNVSLYYNGSQKLYTTNTGISVTGRISQLTDPSAAQDAATKAYVDSQVGANNELSEVLANGNTTGGTDIAVSAGDDITFTDTSKAYFGAGNDLQIYHDGSDSFVQDSGTGDFYVRSNSTLLLKSATTTIQAYGSSETIASFNENGAVELYYDNSKKFETTSTGVTVTGTTIIDQTANTDVNGLNGIRLNDSTGTIYAAIGVVTGNDLRITAGDAGGTGNTAIAFRTATSGSESEKMRIDNSGQVQLNSYGSGSFTGTATYRLAVDSSGDVIEIPIGGGAVDGSGTANYVTKWSDTDTITNSIIYDNGTNVGIGTTSIGARLEVAATATTSVDIAHFSNSNSVHKAIFKLSSVGAGQLVLRDAGNVEDVLISSHGDSYFNGGSVGIGTDSPSTTLELGGSTNTALTISKTGDLTTGLQIGRDTTTLASYIIQRENADLFIRTNNIERMRITSGGSVGIGISSPSQKLHVVGNIRVTGAYYDSNNSSGTADQVLVSTGTGTDWQDLSDISGVDGSGTANTVAMWSDTDTITDSPITISGNNATFAGTVYIPSKLEHTGDSDTFLNFSDNTITLTAGGNATTFAGSGNATFPGDVTVNGSMLINEGNAFTNLQIKSDRTSGNIGGVNFIDYNGAFAGQIYGNTSGDIMVATGGQTIALTVDSSGNVGINETSPTTAKLVVNADQNIYGVRINGDTTTGQSYGVRLRAGTNSVDSALRVENTSASTMFLVRGDGNVGIGTTTPGAKLDVAGDARVGNVPSNSSTTNYETKLIVKGKNNYDDGTNWYGDYGQIILDANSNMTGGARKFMITNALDNTKFAIIRSVDATTDPVTDSTASGVNSGTADFVIDNTGNVGIGVTSPVTKLNVAGNVSITATKAFRMYNTANNGWGEMSYNESDNRIQFNRGIQNSGSDFLLSENSVNSFVCANQGSFGIGTDSPTQSKLVVDGTISIPRSEGFQYLESISGGFRAGIFSTNTNDAGVGYNSLRFFVNSDSSDPAMVIGGSTNIKNVGIGTDSPERKLHVFKGESGGATSNSDSSLVLENSSNTYLQFLTPTTVESGILFGDTDNDVGALTYSHSTNSFNFRTAGVSNRMVIDSSGNVGIGTTSPTLRLDVRGTQGSPASSGTSQTGSLSIRGTGSHFISSGMLNVSPWTGWFQSQDANNLSINYPLALNPNGGNVGIGTDSPDKKLHIVGSTITGASADTNTLLYLEQNANNSIQINSGSSSLGQIRFGDAASNYRGSLTYAHSDDSMQFVTAGSERMRIDSSGNVGIGTDSPQVPLQIGTHLTTAPADTGLCVSNRKSIRINDSDGSYNFGVYIKQNYSGTSYLILGTRHNGTDTDGLVVKNGQVGIGTDSPSAKLDIVNSGLSSQLRLSNTTSDATTKYGAITGRHYTNSEENVTGMLITSSSSVTGGAVSIGGGVSAANAVNQIKFYTAANNTTLTGTERMRIDSSGNVGIGETSLSTKFTVNALATASNNDTPLTVSTIRGGTTSNVRNTELLIQSTRSDTGANRNIILKSQDVGGTSRNLILDASAVGIGTDSPDLNLHLYANDTSGKQFMIDQDSTGDAVMSFRLTGVSEYTMGIDNSDGDKFKIANSGTVGTATRMTIDSSGNVGIGTDSPSAKFNVNSGTVNKIAVFQSSNANANIRVVDVNATVQIENNSGKLILGADLDSQQADSYISFEIDGASEKMRINSDGDVLMNCTSVPSGSGGGAAFETSGTLMRLKQSSPTTSTTKVQIYYNANGEVGSIHTSGSATAFNTSSDYRLKDDYKDFNGLDLVNNINVYDFEWKSDKTRSYGVKAHELQEVIPQAVNGEKDGKEMQQVDYSKLVPILLKSIQELKQEIEILKSK